MRFILVLSTAFFAFLISGFGPGNNESVNHYYYKGEKTYLTPSSNTLFFVLKNKMSSVDFNIQLGQERSLFNVTDFAEGEEYQLISLKSSVSDDEKRRLIESLKRLPAFGYVSETFNVPQSLGNPNVQIGVINEIIVQFKAGLERKLIESYLNARNLEIISELDLSGGETYLLKVPPALNTMAAANEMFESGAVNYSEPNFFQTNLLNYTPNDQFYGSQWSLRNVGNNIPGGISGTVDCDMDVDSAWDVSQGSNAVIVSIVDTGIDTLHSDLSSKIVNGLGYNFYSNNSNSMDDNNHGTCCAGIVGAVTNNTIGVAGVAPNARLFGIKIFNSGGSTTTAAITNGLIHTKTSGCWVSSNSWGGGTPISAADNAILDGVTTGRGGKGIVYCFATGNGNASSISWPSSNPNVIAVGGISPCNQRKSTTSCDNETWWGSNYGTGTTIVAPCVKVYATDRRGSAGYSSTDYFSTFNGTSSATPNAAGVCALVLGLDSTMRWDTLRSRVARLADKVGAYTYNQPGSLNLGGWNNQMGYGRINAYNVMKYTFDNMMPVPATIKLAQEGFYDSLSSRLSKRDTVRFYLRSTTFPFAIVDSAKGVVDSLSLNATVTFSNAMTGTYYVVVAHRNTLETWSKSGGESYIRGSAFSYDFTTSAAQAYGSNMIKVDNSPVRYAVYSGDVNRDGAVDATDVSGVDNDAALYLSGYVISDLTGDNFVDGTDFVLADNNAANYVSVVKP